MQESTHELSLSLHVISYKYTVPEGASLVPRTMEGIQR
jgi:hypothetical protein